jgi:glycosyltransferase involved in cell wall biosynthesis
MTDRCWLTAIVPSHNGERWLAAALQSIVVQDDRGVAVILVDTSDTDRSLEIAASFADRLSIRAVRRPDLASWIEKTNFAAAIAQSRWICMLHQDDLWQPGRASAMRHRVLAHPEAAMHLHPAHVIDATGKRLGTWHCPLPSGESPIPQQVMLPRLLVQNFIAIPTPVISRAAFLRVGGLDERLWYSADWDLYLKLAGDGEVYYHPDTLASFRVHAGSLTMSGSRSLGDFRAQMTIVLDRHIGKLTTGRAETYRTAMASIDVNVGLAAASRGKPARLIRAIARVAMLGPEQMLRYLQYSRLFERALPRLRARIAGVL